MPVQKRKTVLVQTVGFNLGGVQTSSVELAGAVRDLGYDSVVIAPRDTIARGPSLAELAAERGVRLEAFERPRSIVHGARTLAKIAREHQVDIVHAYSGWAYRAAYWGPCRLGRRPLVMTNYEMVARTDTYRAANLIVGTGYLLDELTEKHRRVDLISPPVNLELDDVRVVDASGFISAHDLDTGHLRVVIVGRLDEEMKGRSVEVAMMAVDRLSRTDVDLVLVGGGDGERRLRALGDAINARHGRRMVTFTGPLSDPRPAYACADLVMGMGSSAARGLAFAKPLIVVGEQGRSLPFGPMTADELYRNSFWFGDAPEDAVGELARHLSAVMADAPARAELGRFGRAFGEAHYGLRAMAHKLVSVYEDAQAHYDLRSWWSERDLEMAAVLRHVPAPRQTARRAVDLKLVHS